MRGLDETRWSSRPVIGRRGRERPSTVARAVTWRPPDGLEFLMPSGMTTS
jgi:hypothetical protein